MTAEEMLAIMSAEVEPIEAVEEEISISVEEELYIPEEDEGSSELTEAENLEEVAQ